MFPEEINLPAGVEFFEPNISSFTALEFDEVIDQLSSSDIIPNIRTQDTLIVINDAHRNTPSIKILDALFNIVPENKIKAIVIATGTHKQPGKEELNTLLSRRSYLEQIDVIVHDSSQENMVFLGVTSRGTEVKVNPIIFRYENVVAINSVEPHYFAGFTGGVKSIIPGLAATSTIKKNHAWAIHELSGPTKIAKNPVQQDLQEALGLIEKTFYGIQLVNHRDMIIYISHGELMQAFQHAVLVSKKIYSIKVPYLFDVIVSIVYPPLNRSLYQAQKGIENTRQALASNGTLILIAECPNGIGNDLFFNTLSNFAKPADVLSKITIENYAFGDHKAVKFASLASKANIKIIGNIKSHECKNVFSSSMSMNELEEFLMKQSALGRKIAVANDSGLLVLH